MGEVLEGRFELGEVLGEGGMGQVFKARDLVLDRYVAVKTLLPQFLTDPVATDDMKREVRLAQRLAHPAIVAVYDYRVHQRTPYIVMELVEGTLLLHHVYAHPGHRLPEAAFRALAEPILTGVGFAHQQGVVHRDLKPENIMVLPGGHIKLMDFGIAAAVQANYTRMTGRTSSLSVAYASPEQINGEPPAPSMDIYSLGCVFYAMLCGHPPFYQGEILHQQLNREPPPLEGVSAELNAVVLSCLVKDPGRRLRSVEEVRAALAGNRTVRIPRAAPARSVPPVSAPPAFPGSGRGAQAAASAPGPGPAVWLLGGGAAIILSAVFWALQPAPGGGRPAPAATTAPPQPTMSPEATTGWTPAPYPSPRTVRTPAMRPVGTPPQGPPEPRQRPERDREAAASRVVAAREALEAGDYDRAEAGFRNALAADPGNAEAQAGLAKVRKARQAEQALLGGGATPAAPSLGEADRLVAAGQYDAAIRAYEEVLRARPGDRQAQAGLAKARKAKAAEDSILGR